jgi:2-polyprenyl-3-methyl-5-hydroxy-6-metoxy-1,4-benzoquinol methylase
MTESPVNSFRSKRLAKFMLMLEPGREYRILDIGGTLAFWKGLGGLYGSHKVAITVVNLDEAEVDDANIKVRRGDACNLSEFGDNEFDIVHSNSVIEHVGPWEQVQRMAAEVRRLAPKYFIQTPNIGFPVEPHFRLPFVHWLPEQARISVLQAAGRVPKDPLKATPAVQRIALLSKSQMQALFPDAEIWPEKVFGLTKSLVAIRGGA